MDYIQEPDIFHEIVGHCPLLTHPAFAAFNETYGKLGLEATAQERCFWHVCTGLPLSLAWWDMTQ
nr:hypothetical protein [Psychrobacter sp. PraFG1]UTT87733.1 hypothetical protein MN210_16725 [Psychrobacter sp. PraFG1]